MGRKEKPRQEKSAERKGMQQPQSRRDALGLEQMDTGCMNNRIRKMLKELLALNTVKSSFNRSMCLIVLLTCSSDLDTCHSPLPT